MAKTLTVTIPHHLSQEEVATRLRHGLAHARQQFGAKIGTLEERWTDHRVDFNLTAVGQKATGYVDVRPDTVFVSVDLPWMLAMFAGKIQSQIESEGRKLLGPPDSRGKVSPPP
jgi:hypothetical protein